MFTKLVKRYYCEHCHKGGMTKAIARHEETCIKNPMRVCWVCKEFGMTQVEPRVLLRAALNPNESEHSVLDLTDCPACTVAALSQALELNSDLEWVEYDYRERMRELRQARSEPDFLPH